MLNSMKISIGTVNAHKIGLQALKDKLEKEQKLKEGDKK